MALNFSSFPQIEELRPRIVVVGVGGAGGNAINNMISSGLEGCEFVVANTDAQALEQSLSDNRIQLGPTVTKGLGAGARPEVGQKAAEESTEEIREYLERANMVFITAGMGGGTGTGAAPVIAKLARDMGVLTIGVVSRPFNFEGTKRNRIAEYGVDEMQKYVNTLIVIPNQNLFRVVTQNTSFKEAFVLADQVLRDGVGGVTDLMVKPGIVNLDFADVQTVMSEMGKAMMGSGEAEGEQRAQEAAEAAITNPLLDDASMKGAKAVLVNICGGENLTLYEMDEAVARIRQEIDPDANVIFGATLDESLDKKIRVSVVATGMDIPAQEAKERHQSTSSQTSAFVTPQSTSAPGQTPVAHSQATVAPRQTASHGFTAPPARYDTAPVPTNTFVPQRAMTPQEASRAPQQAPLPPQQPVVAKEKPTEGGGSLFGNLLARTSGFRPTQAAPKPVVDEAPQQENPLDLDNEDIERIEIPSFLRRQAN